MTAVESRGGADKTDVFGAGLKWFITLARQFAMNQIVWREAHAQLSAGRAGRHCRKRFRPD